MYLAITAVDKIMRIFFPAMLGLTFLMFSVQSLAFDPITSLVGKAISTAMDVRSKDEVKSDVDIDMAVTKKLVDQKGDDFKNISILVFARHAVLVGYAKDADVKREAEALAKSERKIRSLKNDILIGAPAGGVASNLVLDKKIDLSLTATKGVSSVNMRWKVYGGDVFLMGIAQSRKEADLAIAEIRKLEGVKNVRPSLRIVKPAKK